MTLSLPRVAAWPGVLPLYAGLLTANAVAWIWALAVFHGNLVLIGTAALAYLLGLRHAVDADHIAAIDNVVRKLMQEGQRPLTVGLYFSLGHSTVVILACAAVAVMSSALRAHFAAFGDVAGLIGTGVSAAFLFAIALGNVATLRSVLRGFRGPTPTETTLPSFEGGLLTRILRPAMRLVSAPWRMYPLGFLFGLGFDTASEIALLGIASQASQHIPLASIMIFPALFTAGMSLVDTSDGVLMLGAYGWAALKPARRLTYNVATTLLSVLVALVVGVLELLDLLANKLALSGAVWRWIAALNQHFGAIGLSIVLLFAVCWAIAVFGQRMTRGVVRQA